MTMRAILIVCALAMLSGCPATIPQQPQPTRIVDTACDWVKPITTVPADTLDTKIQILALDKAYIANCPKKN